MYPRCTGAAYTAPARLYTAKYAAPALFIGFLATLCGFLNRWSGVRLSPGPPPNPLSLHMLQFSVQAQILVCCTFVASCASSTSFAGEKGLGSTPHAPANHALLMSLA